MAPMTLPPGFRFHPTDEELVAYYLDRKITGRTIELEIIPEVDLYKCEPWDLPDKSLLPSKDMEWYFYSPRDKKYPNGSRTNRATRAGYWKATGKDRAIRSQKESVGMKKTLVYYRGRAPRGIRSNWVMHEYRLVHSACGTASPTLKDSYALCRIFKKPIQTPKTNEEPDGNTESDSMWISDEHDQQPLPDHDNNNGKNGKNATTIIDENFRLEDEQILNNTTYYSKLPSETSSSDLTQGTPTRQNGTIDDFRPSFISDEANSSANYRFSFGLDFSSNLLQDLQKTEMSNESNLLYPPLEIEDFPQINMVEKKASKLEHMDEFVMHDKYMNGTLEEIFSLCSSQQIIPL